MAGANTRNVKRRIKSADNIAQITRAMEMVAASKMKKAQERALQAKPYASKVNELTTNLVSGLEGRLHPLLIRYADEKIKKAVIILMTTNKGLCGSLNTNLLRHLEKWLESLKDKKLEFITLGKKGQSLAAHQGKLIADFSTTAPLQDSVGPIITLIKKKFLQKEIQAVFIIYNDFISALKFSPQIQKLLPVSADLTPTPAAAVPNKPQPVLVEPSVKAILSDLIPFYLESQLRRAIFEAEASEHSARMLAMKNATDNASDLVDGLTLEYNKLRQEMITREISDIVTAKVSLEP